MNNVSEADKAIYKSLINTKDDVIQIMKNQVEIIEQINKAQIVKVDLMEI